MPPLDQMVLVGSFHSFFTGKPEINIDERLILGG